MSSVEHARPAPSTLEMPLVVRGASRGFTVLLIGGVVQPWVYAASAVVGFWWLAIVAVAAFSYAARAALPVDARRSAWTNGPVAALGSYLLVLPIVLSAAGTFPLVQVLLTGLTALVVGSLTAAVRVRSTGSQ